MDSRYLLLPLFALPWLLRRTDRPGSARRDSVEKPVITSIELPPTFRKWSARTASIDAIVLHCTEGGPDALKSAQHALRPVEQGGRRASFHNVIGRDGVIVQLVPWERQAWHCSSLRGLLEITWNNRSIGIEICALPNQKMTAAQERALVHLIRYLLKRFAIPVENITAHRFTGANTSCPDALFPTQEALAQWKRQHFAEGFR
jgi:N-acetyl-anhydromuramyl-L-alanine amidase AmpD